MDTPKLSTMVVLYNTNLKFDTTKLVEQMPLLYGIIRVEKRGVLRKGESKRDLIKRRSKKETNTNNTGFGNNSMTLVMLNNGDGTLPEKEITVKIFQNGVFHMTGILDDRYDRSVMSSLLTILQNEARESIVECPETYSITQRRVVLMNYTTKLHMENVPRQALYNAIRRMDLENVKAEYDPDVYPGVKVRIGPNKWIAKIFRTGKVILTGITTKEHCVDFVEQLTTLLASAFASTSSASASASR
jgi:ArsR family metal-binding transcriptional regulator